MDISFDKPRHERLSNDINALSKKFDRRYAGASVDIIATLDVLAAANSLADIPHSYRPHPLKASLKGHFAVDVTNKHRVIFRPDHKGDQGFRIDNYKTITAIVITEIFKDYH